MIPIILSEYIFGKFFEITSHLLDDLKLFNRAFGITLSVSQLLMFSEKSLIFSCISSLM